MHIYLSILKKGATDIYNLDLLWGISDTKCILHITWYVLGFQWMGII